MYFRTQPLLVVLALSALSTAAQTQEVPIVDNGDVADTSSPFIFDRVCLTDVKDRSKNSMSVTTESCQRAIDKLFKEKKFINPPKIGCLELVTAGQCSIGICGNEAIDPKIVAEAAQQIHAWCKPLGQKSKHVVAGTIQVANVPRKDGSVSGPAKIVMGRTLQGLVPRSEGDNNDEDEDGTPASPTRVHAKDLHAPTHSLDVRDQPTPTFLVNGGQLELRLMLAYVTPRRPLPGIAIRSLIDSTVDSWEHQETINGGMAGRVTVESGAEEVAARLEYAARNGYDLSDILPDARRPVVEAFNDFRSQQGSPWHFAVGVWSNGINIGLMAMDVFLPAAEGYFGAAGPAV
jgi:hypothetical protein